MKMPPNSGGPIVILVATAVFAISTYVAVDLANGGLMPSNSNTPNATVPGPPAFK